MTIQNIDEAAQLKAELQQWEGSLYNIRRLLAANGNTKSIQELSTSDRSIFGKIRLWFECKAGKYEIKCGQPYMGNLSAGCSEKFGINVEQLAIFCDFIESITKEKKQSLLALIGGDTD